MGNASDQPILQKLYTLKNTMINEEIAIIGLMEVNSNWSKIPIKQNIYNRTDTWFKTRIIITGYNQATISDGTFKLEAHITWW